MNRYGRQRLVAVSAAAVIVVLGAAHPVALQAADPPWDPPPCADEGSAEDGHSTGSWFRLAPVIDGTGTLVQQEVRLGGAGDARERRIDLPPEAFATGPFAGAVLVGEDDGSMSRLRLVDPRRGCATAVGSSSAVVRVAVVDPAGRAVYEHRVDRGTRADLGVWRRPLDGGRAVRVLAGIRADAAYGPTFGTELAWGSDGRLAVASCGERACRVRVIEPGGRAVRELGPTGAIVGLAGDELVAYDVCPGPPCDIHALGIREGSRRTLAVDAGPAALAGVSGSRLVYETAMGSLRSVVVATGRTVAEAHVPSGAAPVRSTSGSGRGASMPDGWLLLDDPAGRYLAADPAALSAHPIAEVSR